MRSGLSSISNTAVSCQVVIMTDSIEDTNRIRVSLGLKPLPAVGGASFKKTNDASPSSSESDSDDDPHSTLEKREAQGYANYKAIQDSDKAKIKAEERNLAIKKAREAAQRFAKLEGKGLADEDDKESALDTKAWLLGQKKRRKRLEKQRIQAERLQAELEERERTAIYNVENVEVAHAMEDFDDDQGQVLTLKDQDILDEEGGNVLEASALVEQAKLEERMATKRKRPVYDPTEDGERTILGHYDEKESKRFKLDHQGFSMVEKEERRKDVAEKLKKEMISLDTVKGDVLVSDYQEAKEVKIKKPKKKKAKSTRQKAADEDDIFPDDQVNGAQTIGDSVHVDPMNGEPVQPKAKEDISFVDDDDLQASLALQRRAALKKRKKAKPEDIARQLREEASATPDRMVDDAEEEGGLVLDETTEFVAGLQRKKEERQQDARQIKAESPTAKVKPESPEEDPDAEMGGLLDEREGSQELKERAKRETSTPTAPGLTETGLEDEQTLDKGMGAALKMVTQRGMIERRDDDDLVARQRNQQRFLHEKRQREAEIERKARLQRERDRASGKLAVSPFPLTTYPFSHQSSLLFRDIMLTFFDLHSP